MRCEDCRKREVETSTWLDRFKKKLIKTFFVEEWADMVQDKYTQGFSDGYKTGFQHSTEHKTAWLLEQD